MDKITFKKAALEEAKTRQQQLIDDLRTRINDMLGSEMNRNEGQFDHDQQSMDEAGNEVVDRLATQLNFAVEEYDRLNLMRVEDRLHDRVALGSIVKTDKLMFYPSVSVERFDVEGRTLYGISEKAPLFQAMKDKQAGDTFSYKDDKYKILEVF